MTMEDQPDPRAAVLLGWCVDKPHQVTAALRAIDAADRSAGIRRVTEDTAAAERVRQWCAFRRAHHISPDDLLGVSYQPAPLFLADIESLVGGS